MIVGVQEESPLQSVIFPNPTIEGQSFTVKAEREIAQVRIISLAGKLIRDESFNQKVGLIQTNSISSGMYFVELINVSGEKEVHQLVIR